MVCEFVWKSQQQGDGSDNENDNKSEDGSKSKRGNGDEETKETYDDYRKRFSLNYVRSFFNTHMDDSWFRIRYSPLGKKRAVMAERERSKHEAASFQSELAASLEGSIPEGERCSFVKEARLGGGVKTAAGTDSAVPKTHMLSVARSENVLHITDIPPHVTDEQLTLALMDHCMIAADEQAQGSPIPDGTKLVSGKVTADHPKQPLWREAFLICSATVKQDIVTHLIKAESEAADPSSSTPKEKDETKSEEPAVVVPRKKHDDDKTRSTLPLDVECSDPYGRLDVDADGKGGAPEDGVGVTNRKSTVWVHTHYKAPSVQVLSAAISSKERLGRDKDAAIMMARALDVAKDVAPENRLDDLLDKVFGTSHSAEEEEDPTLVEDTLDVAIAYLRRVHLFSFYNGCMFSSNVADVLSGKHAAGTIHMRLHNADEILAEDSPSSNATGDGDGEKPAPPKDLLVSRLDASVEKALEECQQWIDSGGTTIVDERVDREAEELEKAEEEWKDTWLENHAMIDDDGRARCSFHFCHKLFKDKNFLRKHLQKKHKEFLRAEQAQLHDEYMMKAWDEEICRPVPPVLVDCGANFDLVPSPVLGSEPMAADPEPDLWRKEEERRKREEELQQQRAEQRRLANENRPERHQRPEGDERRNSHGNNSRPAKNFVDVDDMKEEKVEMAFDTVDVPVQPPKKKKKKKKLL